jgi:Tfp pilus assembly protein PilO
MTGLVKLILIGVGGLAITLVVFGVVIYPNLNQVTSLYDQAVVKQTDLETLSAQILAYENSQSDLNAAQDKSKILSRILPRENLQEAIAEVESAAAFTGVDEALTIQEQFDSKGVPLTSKVLLKNENLSTEVTYTMNITGSFESVLKFMQYLEHLPHFTEISSLTLSSSTSTSNTSGLAQHGKNISAVIQGIFLVQKTSK